MIRKLSTSEGETIAEVLIASLIVMLGVLLFSMMVSSAFRIVTRAESSMVDYYTWESAAEEQTVSKGGATVSVSYGSFTGIAKAGDITSSAISVTTYGSDEIKSYQ